MKTIKFLFFILSFLLFSCNSKDKGISLDSPGKLTTINIGIDRSNDNQLFFSIHYLGEEVVKHSPVEISIVGSPSFGKNLSMTSIEKKEINETWERVWGKSKKVLNHCFEVSVSLKEDVPPFRNFNLVARAYDDGIAFRYQFPRQEQVDSFYIGQEQTVFHFAQDYEIWASPQLRFRSAQEREYQKLTLSKLKTSDIIVTPLLIKLNTGWAALLEANVTNWAGMYLTSGKDSSNLVKPLLSPYPEDNSIAVKSKAPANSPWRILMFGESAGDLVESNLLHNLSEPNILEDVSWIVPGRCAWDPWWSGGYAPGLGRRAVYDNASMKYFIDLASEMGWEYQLVDWLWYDGMDDNFKRNPLADITKSSPKIDIPSLVEYAKSKNVKLFLWLHWDDANRQMDKAFPLYEEWGIAGVKVDFMDRNDQFMVNFYERLISKASEHKLLVDFHGAHMPTGLDRTYPNFLTCEGVLGNEFSKRTARITPEHCVTIPFTRMLGGQMDFTPGGFHQAPPGEFIPTGKNMENPWVQGTRCFQLAMPVIYESALTVFCDSPDNYRGQEGIEFYKIVPTTWDETKVIDGYPGEFIVIARKNGDNWFMGAMTNRDERVLKIPLNFLDDGDYTATIFSDADDVEVHPENLDKKVIRVDKSKILEVVIAGGGGYVVHFDRN